MISLPDLADQFSDGFPKEIEAELSAQKRLLQCFATYTLALHSDIAQKRRLASLTALGMTQDEVIGTQFLLDAHDMQLMKDTVARRKDKAVLAGVAGLRKPLIKKKFKKKYDRNGRGRGMITGTRNPSLASETTKVMMARMRPVRALRTALHTSPRVPRGRLKASSNGGRASKYAAFRSLCAGQPV